MALLKFSNRLLKFNNGVLSYVEAQPDPYNPLNLPPNTIRFKYISGIDPTSELEGKGTLTCVDSTENIWDLNFSTCKDLFKYKTNLLEILGANTAGITNMASMFEKCSSLTSVALFDTSNVTTTDFMFENCTSLMSVPAFDTHNVMYFGSEYGGMFAYCNMTTLPAFDCSNAVDIRRMCYNCYYLTSLPKLNNITNKLTKADYAFYITQSVTDYSGVELYEILSSLNPQPSHEFTFNRCARNGNYDAWSQIPNGWK